MHRTYSLPFFITLVVGFIVMGAASILFAWTGPTQTAPNGNVAAPINVGTTDQIKNAGLGVNSLAVYGNGYVEGNLGVGVVSPAYKLDVSGDIHNTGNMYSAGYFHNSDARLKRDVRTISGIDIISRLRGVLFNWNDGTPGVGVIAQEVEAVLPSAVHTNADGMKSVDYGALVAPLIEAIKEQQAQIDALKKEIAILKAAR